MNYMKYMLILIIIIIILNYYYYTTSNTNILNITNQSLGFVKPEHRLYKILSTISSGSKINLKGKCVKYIFTKNTIHMDIKKSVLEILNKVIDNIKNISRQDYYIKTIENIYCLIGRNQRYIVDFFLFDVANYYTIRILADIVIVDGDIYINYINTQPGSNPILLDKYDIKFNSSGILFDENMFHNNIEELLNKYYNKTSDLININNDINIEYTAEDLSKVYSLNTMNNLYFPTTLSKLTLEDYNKKGVLGLSEKFLPSNQVTINSQQICNDDSCIHRNTSTQNRINEPYQAPGVIYERASNDAYKYLKRGSGTIYNLI